MKFDISLLAAGALTLGGIGVSGALAEPLRYLAKQDSPPSDNVAQYSVSTDAFLIAGGRYAAGINSTITDFVNQSTTNLGSQLNTQLSNMGWTSIDAAAFTGVVIMDIEGEANASLIDHHGPDPVTDPAGFTALVDAIRMKVHVTKAFFPNAEIGYWQVGSVNANGGHNQANIDYLMDLGDAGAFDEVDYFVPQLYPIRCPGDTWCNGTLITNLDVLYENRATGTVAAAKMVLDSNGDPLKVMPMLTGRMLDFAGGCAQTNCAGMQVLDADPGLDDTLGPQMSAFDLAGAEAVGYWRNWITDGKEPGDYFGVLYTQGDYDRDCDVDNDDLTIYLGYFTGADDEADILAPFSAPDAFDYLHFLSLIGNTCTY